MFTSTALADTHERTHRCLLGLLEHCDGFSPEELARPLDGFGYPTVLEQLHHVIGAEQYWIGVLNGLMLTEEDEADRRSIDTLRAYRDRVAGVTEAYLQGATDADLNTPCEVTTWGNKQATVVPAFVFLRTQTHMFQHQGQITAMVRLLGRPVPPGLDFALA